MSEKFSLKDHLFNADSLGDLAAEYAAGVRGFDADGFLAEVLPGLASRELLERLDWIADCVEAQLAPEFPTMADQIEAALPPELDPSLRDDDFGRFIHAVPGILTVRHGLNEAHFARSMDVLHAATRRFSMEFYIRPFLNEFEDQTFAQLRVWAEDPNYHVRRLVSEGTRPKLPWAKAIRIDPLAPLELLDRLHADPTRYVTRSVSNHLNDISKIAPDQVLQMLADWQAQGRQGEKELAWMTRHALRTLIKQGYAGAMDFLGYRPDAAVAVDHLEITETPVRIGGKLQFDLTLTGPAATPVIVDYILQFHKPDAAPREKVFKLKMGEIGKDGQLKLKKTHPLKANASTFSLYPGPHRLTVQVNGRQLTETRFNLV